MRSRKGWRTQRHWCIWESCHRPDRFWKEPSKLRARSTSANFDFGGQFDFDHFLGALFRPILARRVGALRAGAVRGVVRRVGARTVGGPKFRAFFLLPPQISLFLSLGFCRGIVAAVQGLGPHTVPVCVSLGSFCASPGGLHSPAPESTTNPRASGFFEMGAGIALASTGE